MNLRKGIFSFMCWLLFCQFLLAACSANPPIDFEEGYLNQQLLLSAPGHFNTFNTRDSIYLEIRSTSKYEIVLPNDLNLRIFERKAGDWIEIPEFPTTRSPAGDVIFSRINKSLEMASTFPNLPDPTRNYRLRIYVSGDMKTEAGIKQVAAYVNITLHP
jgi:hypothetical protein